jgi:hypothetical protein
MSELAALEEIEAGLTQNRREALSLGDDFLVFVLSVAGRHIQKKSAAPPDASAGATMDSKSSAPRTAQVYFAERRAEAILVNPSRPAPSYTILSMYIRPRMRDFRRR